MNSIGEKGAFTGNSAAQTAKAKELPARLYQPGDRVVEGLVQIYALISINVSSTSSYREASLRQRWRRRSRGRESEQEEIGPAPEERVGDPRGMARPACRVAAAISAAVARYWEP